MQKDVPAGEAIKPDSFLPAHLAAGAQLFDPRRLAALPGLQRPQLELAIAIVLSLLHLASQAAAIYVVYWYGRQMEQTGLVTVPFLDLHMNLKEHPNGCGPSSRLSTVCFIVSAALLYLVAQA